jgi:hypothetical protein
MLLRPQASQAKRKECKMMTNYRRVYLYLIGATMIILIPIDGQPCNKLRDTIRWCCPANSQRLRNMESIVTLRLHMILQPLSLVFLMVVTCLLCPWNIIWSIVRGWSRSAFVVDIFSMPEPSLYSSSIHIMGESLALNESPRDLLYITGGS